VHRPLSPLKCLGTPHEISSQNPCRQEHRPASGAYCPFQYAKSVGDFRFPIWAPLRACRSGRRCPDPCNKGCQKPAADKKAGRIPQEGLQCERDCSICHGDSCPSVSSRHQRHLSSQFLVPATFDISECDHCLNEKSLSNAESNPQYQPR